MRKVFAAGIVAAAVSGALSATPASADCVSISGTPNPIITVAGPFGPTTVYAPGNVDTDPWDCITTAREIIGA